MWNNQPSGGNDDDHHEQEDLVEKILVDWRKNDDYDYDDGDRYDDN